MCQDNMCSIAQTKKNFKDHLKPSRQTIEWMYLHRSVRLFRLFVQALLCFDAVCLFTPPFFRVRAGALDI